MNKYNLSDMKGGWFVGDFSPTIVKTDKFEVACKHYRKGDKEQSHRHKEAEEITLIAEGSVLMNGELFCKNDIIQIEKGEATDFEALSDCITMVVKFPSVMGDKYFI